MVELFVWIRFCSSPRASEKNNKRYIGEGRITYDLTLNRFYSSPGPPSVAFTEALGSGNKFARVRAVHTKKTIRRRQLINAPQNTDPCQLLRPVEIRTGRTCSTGCNLVTFAAFLSHFWSSNFRDGRALPFLVAPCSDLGSWMQVPLYSTFVMGALLRYGGKSRRFDICLMFFTEDKIWEYPHGFWRPLFSFSSCLDHLRSVQLGTGCFSRGRDFPKPRSVAPRDFADGTPIWESAIATVVTALSPRIMPKQRKPCGFWSLESLGITWGWVETYLSDIWERWRSIYIHLPAIWGFTRAPGDP